MIRLTSAVMAAALLVSVAPVLAGDSFYALSRLPANLTPMDDAQLATVEGGQTAVAVCPNPPGCNIADVTIDQDATNKFFSFGSAFVAGDDLNLNQSNTQGARIVGAMDISV